MWLICALAVIGLLSAAPPLPAAVSMLVVEDWQAYQEGLFNLGRTWERYPFSSGSRYGPFIASDGSEGKVLRVRTENDVVTIGRKVTVDVARTPLLAWRWKALALPPGGDARHPSRDDQVLRVVLLFEPAGWGKAIGYIWDSNAPTETVLGKKTFPAIDRRPIVVRSGSEAVGVWHQETRDVLTEYERLFGGQPLPVSYTASLIYWHRESLQRYALEDRCHAGANSVLPPECGVPPGIVQAREQFTVPQSGQIQSDDYWLTSPVA